MAFDEQGQTTTIMMLIPTKRNKEKFLYVNEWCYSWYKSGRHYRGFEFGIKFCVATQEKFGNDISVVRPMMGPISYKNDVELFLSFISPVLIIYMYIYNFFFRHLRQGTIECRDDG